MTKTTVQIEEMIEYLQTLSDCYESSNYSDSILNSLSACHLMVEKLIGRPVKFERNEEGKVIVTI